MATPITTNDTALSPGQFGGAISPTITGVASTNPTNNVAPKAGQAGFIGPVMTPAINNANQSTTTLSSANPTTKIPAITAKTDALGKKGITTQTNPDGTTVSTTANGQVYTPAKTVSSNNFNPDGSY